MCVHGQIVSFVFPIVCFGSRWWWPSFLFVFGSSITSGKWQHGGCKSWAVFLHNTAFGAISVNHGKHIWKLKIVKKTTKLCIGISSSTQTINCNFHRQRTYPNYGYNWDGSKISHQTKYQRYGKPLRSGQVITIILDLDKRQLSFMNDNHNLGIAFEDVIVGDTVQYRVALSMVDLDDKVQIIGYGKLTDDDDNDGADCDDESNDTIDLNSPAPSNSCVSNSKDESKDGDENKEEMEENMELNVNDMEYWDNAMCIQWARNIAHKEMSDMNGMDMLYMLRQLQHEYGTYSHQEALKLKCDQQSKMMQFYQHKLTTLNQQNNKLEKKIETINGEKDNLLTLYQLKEEEIQIAKMENERLRSQLMKLQLNM